MKKVICVVIMVFLGVIMTVGRGLTDDANTLQICNIFIDDAYARDFITDRYNLSGDDKIIEYKSCNDGLTQLFGTLQTQMADTSWGVGTITSKNWGNLCVNMSYFLSTLSPEQFKKFLSIYGHAVRNIYKNTYYYNHAATIAFTDSLYRDELKGSLRLIKNTIEIIQISNSGDATKYIKLLNGYVLNKRYDKALTILNDKNALGDYSADSLLGTCEFFRISYKRGHK